MTTFGDMVFHLGGVPLMAGLPFTKNSKYYFVDPANGNDSNVGTDLANPLATIIQAFNNTTANQHDAVIYIAGSSSVNMTAALTWSKSYTHLIGIAAPTMPAVRARIFQLSTLTGASPLFSVTATGCIFKNFYCFQGVNDATSLINWQVSGGRNYFENVHFAGGGHTAQAIDAGSSLRLVGSSGEHTFVNCTFGVDTVAAATGLTCLSISGGTPRNQFKGCNFTLFAGDAGATFVEWEALSAVDRYMIFDNCSFINTGTTTMDQAFSIPASVPAHRRCFLKDSWGYGFTDWEENDRSVLYIGGGTSTAGGTSALYQASAVT